MSEAKKGDRVVLADGRTGRACDPGPVMTRVILDKGTRGPNGYVTSAIVDRTKLEKA